MSELELAKDKMNEAWREFYLRNPDIFIENWFNIKLNWYQKIVLKQMMRDKKFGDMYDYGVKISERYSRK